MNEKQLLERITVNPKIFKGKPIIRGRRLAVEHIVISDNDETNQRVALYPPTLLSLPKGSQRGRKGGKTALAPLSLLGRGVGGEGFRGRG
ncbi:MAG: hypothetical protein Fur0025_43210 [Oscillatoriaceae cyanobacterium]